MTAKTRWKSTKCKYRANVKNVLLHQQIVTQMIIMKNIWTNKWIQYRWWFTSGKKKLELHDIMIVVRSLFNDHNKYILKFS